MKKSIFATILLVLLALIAFIHFKQPVKSEYEQWKAQYGFVFSESQDKYREIIFSENVKKINKHN